MDWIVNTKWSKGDKTLDNGEIGTLTIENNNIKFHLNGYSDIFARNFVGNYDDHVFKVYTYGEDKYVDNGHLYQVSKAFLYNGFDHSEFAQDAITNIESFSFEILGLTEWLGFKSVDVGVTEKQTAVIYEVETPTIILLDGKIKIYIKYESKDFIESLTSYSKKTITKTPRIFVEFNELKTDKEVLNIIERITRFFAIVMGRVGYANDIRLKLYGRKMRMWLFFNHDFSFNLDSKAYIFIDRINSKFALENIQLWFTNWFVFCGVEQYEMLLNAYFQMHSKKTHLIDEMFLTYCRFIEGYDLRISTDEDKADRLKEHILEPLKAKELKDIFNPIFNSVGSSYRPKDLAKWIATGFLERIGLTDRLKRIDGQHLRFISSNYQWVYGNKEDHNLYQQITQTRNYFSHYKADSTGLLTLQEMHNTLPVLDATITSILLSQFGIEEDTKKNVFAKDQMYGFISHHLILKDEVE